MSSLLVLVPLRIEQLALGVPPGSRVLRTGMGPARARIAAARALADPAPALAVAGLCAGIAPELAAGDVVCAVELAGADGERIALPAGPLLACALRRRGLRVHTGALLSSERILGPGERDLRRGEALAVDMESVWLAAGAAGRPLAVARVVADVAGRRLADPRLLIAGPQALRSLRRVGGALSEWAAALPPELLPVEAPGGSCSAAEPAIDIVEQALADREAPAHVPKQTVTERHAVANLERGRMLLGGGLARR